MCVSPICALGDGVVSEIFVIQPMRALKNLFGWLLASLMTLGLAGMPMGVAIAQVSAAESGRWSELADTVFEYLARDNELPNSTAPTALAEDGAGFLWVGTQNGLARWDGYHFRSYKADPTAAGALPDNLIRQLRTDKARAAYVATLRAKTTVYIALAPPKVNVDTQDAQMLGPEKAPVTLVEFADYECPYCQKVAADLRRLKTDMGDKLSFTYKDFPLSMHARAEKAAEATRCASKQGKFWELHDEIFRSKGLDVDQLKAEARTLKLNGDDFDKCLDSGEEAAVVDKDRREGARLGITGTPAFFINGHFLSGALDYATLRQVVEQQLAAQPQSVANAGSK